MNDLLPRMPIIGRREAPRDGAARLFSALARMMDRNDWQLRLWNGRTLGTPDGAGAFTVTLRDRAALNRLVGALPERAFGRAYISGLVDIEPLQPFLATFTVMPPRRVMAALPGLIRAAATLGVRPDRRPTAAEARLRGRRHSRARDAEAIRHHYDLPPTFYALWLDPTMTYSCGYFTSDTAELDDAQTAKLDLVCRKLRLQPGERLLDIGCGWGSLGMHAARHYGVHCTGITVSRAQVDYARQRARDEGLDHLVDIRLADYRDRLPDTYDAVASVGMIEHVGKNRIDEFSGAVERALRPGGRALVHGITLPPLARWNRKSFIDAFVFPDGELVDIGTVDRSLECTGLEVRDVEDLREHYTLTLRQWARRLEGNLAAAEAIAGAERTRVWQLYLHGAALGFELGTVRIHQTLAVKPYPDGSSGLPLTRADWFAPMDQPAAAR